MAGRQNNARKFSSCQTDTANRSRLSAENASVPLAVSQVPLDVGVYHSPDSEVGRKQYDSPVSWFMSEFVLGPLFLVLTHVYTFVVPQSIASTGDIRIWAQRIIKRLLDIVAVSRG